MRRRARATPCAGSGWRGRASMGGGWRGRASTGGGWRRRARRGAGGINGGMKFWQPAGIVSAPSAKSLVDLAMWGRKEAISYKAGSFSTGSWLQPMLKPL
jgi:hypothetical protein